MNASPNVREAIHAIVERLVAEYTPERIILFGSYAHGRPDEHGNTELLIIKDSPERLIDRITRVRRVTSGTHRHIPFDPIVLIPTELHQRLEGGDQFLAEILRRGEVLYAA